LVSLHRVNGVAWSEAGLFVIASRSGVNWVNGFDLGREIRAKMAMDSAVSNSIRQFVRELRVVLPKVGERCRHSETGLVLANGYMADDWLDPEVSQNEEMPGGINRYHK
jgi:hypothetical protein